MAAMSFESKLTPSEIAIRKWMAEEFNRRFNERLAADRERKRK